MNFRLTVHAATHFKMHSKLSILIDKSTQKLSRKLQDDWVTLEKGQYPLTMKVSEINSKKVAILMKIDDINQANERWNEKLTHKIKKI